MTKAKNDKQPTVRKQLGILFHPKNLVKTAASAMPLGSPLAEILNQLEGHETGQRAVVKSLLGHPRFMDLREQE